jgi:hypothetical protein
MDELSRTLQKQSCTSRRTLPVMSVETHKKTRSPCFRISDVLAGIRSRHLTKCKFRAVNILYITIMLVMIPQHDVSFVAVGKLSGVRGQGYRYDGWKHFRVLSVHTPWVVL